MFNFDDIIVGRKELFTVKYPSTVNDYHSAIMDLYLDTPDSLSLQEMLDMDIKSDMESVFAGHSEISFNFSEMPDVDECSGDPNNWFSTSSNHSNSNLFDFGNEGASKMVNPNAVMPLSINLSKAFTPTLASQQNLDESSPSPKQSHLTFSPASINVTNIKMDSSINTVKKDLLSSLDTSRNVKMSDTNITTTIPVQIIKTQLPKQVHVLSAKTVSKSSETLLNPQTIKVSVQKQTANINVTQIESHSNNSVTRQNTHGISRKVKKFQDEDENPFPKPTYSYSCLIAMALKNSRTGSLPVSEIYNFMCEHFPYFKTAPNGWKNSVRHNLSLNKCFEKIEKPAVNGSQRKGCLWAMHPDKISKMDEEVQKWSRKDPAAIRRAMVYPDQLEALERGELKYGSDGYIDSTGEVGSDSDIDTENEELEVDHNITIREDTNSQTDFIEINSLGDSYDEASLTDYDNEAGDNIYEEVEVENEDEALRMEIALAQQELFNYETTNSNKRARSSTTNVVDYVYQPISSGRRKTPLIVRNNSNTSFIEITVVLVTDLNKAIKMWGPM